MQTVYSYSLSPLSIFLWNCLPFVPFKRQRARRCSKHSEENRTPKCVCTCMLLSASQAAFICQHLFSFHCLFSLALCQKACQGMYLWLKLHVEKCGSKGVRERVAARKKEKAWDVFHICFTVPPHLLCFFMLLLGYFWDPLVSQCHFLDLEVLELHLEVRNRRGGSLGQGLSTFFMQTKAVAVHCFAPLE